MAGRMDEALTEPATEQEVRAAIESVFPFSMLAQFLTLPNKDKELQLSELPYVVLGICLYNQAKGSIKGKALHSALLQSTADVTALHARCTAELQALHVMLHGYCGDSSSYCCMILVKPSAINVWLRGYSDNFSFHRSMGR